MPHQQIDYFISPSMAPLWKIPHCFTASLTHRGPLLSSDGGVIRSAFSPVDSTVSGQLAAGEESKRGTAMSTMKFCRECNNILYPKEDREQKILLYACRNCDHQEAADNFCVYRNVVDHSASEFTQVLQDVAADPTLPRTKSVKCAVCGHPEAVFFQATARGEEGMTLFFVCCNPSCGYRWRD